MAIPVVAVVVLFEQWRIWKRRTCYLRAVQHSCVNKLEKTRTSNIKRYDKSRKAQGKVKQKQE